jgi:hypothetical protein
MVAAMSMSVLRGYFAPVAVLLLALGAGVPSAWGRGMAGPNVVIQLRLTGDGAIPQLRSCLAAKLSQMPDIEIATAPTRGVRFIIDIVSAINAPERISASLVVVETFPTAEYRPRLKAGEDADALSAAIRYYTLLRLHEVVPGRSALNVCARVAADIDDKVLSKEYTERDD